MTTNEMREVLSSYSESGPSKAAKGTKRTKTTRLSAKEAKAYWEGRVRKSKSGISWCYRRCDTFSIPADPLPAGFFLVHNKAKGCGFQVWVQKKGGKLVRCHCDFGGLRNKGRPVKPMDVPKHYKTKMQPAD